MTPFSIITICRNNLDGLRLTVESVLSQTLPPAEFIVVDGASADGTVEWLAAREFPAYLSWESEADTGIYDAMNKGLRRRRQPGLVMFLNAGDTLAEPTTLATIAHTHAAHRWRWAFGSALMVDADRRPVYETVPRSPSRWLFLIGVAPVPHQAAVFSTDLLESVGDFDHSAGVGADQQHMLRCWLAEPPFGLEMLVAHCDAAGVSQAEAADAVARAMRNYRRQLGVPLLGSETADRLITVTVSAAARVASVSNAGIRARQALTRVRSGLQR